MEVRCDEGVAIRHGPEPCVFAFPEAVRRIVHTTNAIESLNAKLRRPCAREAIFRPMRRQQNRCILSCVGPPENGKCAPREWCEAKN